MNASRPRLSASPALLLPLALASLVACNAADEHVAPAPVAAATGSAALACDAPPHPFMAPNGESNIHGDAYMSDTYPWAGPSSKSLAVVDADLGGECASITFDAQGRIVTVCISPVGAKRVLLLDAHKLTILASYDGLPKGLSTTSFGAGGYFYLDELGRAVIPTVDGNILRLAVKPGSPPAFTVDATFPLEVAGGLTSADGTLESVMPDWSGRIWFVTEAGAVGFVDPATKKVSVARLPGEAIGNSFAVDETGGVFIVSDHALYRFDVDASGAPTVTWREAYDHGTRKKPGQINFGSGTTPTLFGTGWVSITDNADPRMNVLVYARGKDHAGSRKLCEVPVFQAGTSATENSLIGCNRSMVVENNYGYSDPFAAAGDKVTTPGFARVDVRADASGCDVVWEKYDQAAPSVVSKLSVASNAVFSYTKAEDGWYLTTLDFQTGATRSQAQIGPSFDFNNHYAPVTLAADGTAYVGVIHGLVAIKGK